MSAMTGNTIKYKVASVAIGGSYTGLATVPSLYFTGGGLAAAAAAGAAGYFNYATVNAYSYNTGNYYADTQYTSLGSTQFGGGIKGTTVNTTSGSITYGGYNLGSFTASTKTVPVSGGALASASVSQGGLYRTGGMPWSSSQPLANGTYSYNFLPTGSVFAYGYAIGTCTVTFTNGVLTSVQSISNAGFPGPYADGSTSTYVTSDGLYAGTGGNVYAQDSLIANLAILSYTRTALVYSYPITVDTITPTYQMLGVPGPITVSYGGTTISVTLSAETAYQPTYYNLQSVTLTQVGSYYTTAVTPISSNGSVTLTANMVIA